MKRHPGRSKKTEWPTCKACGCGRSTKGGSLGFCHSHYVANRRGHLRTDGTWVNTGRSQRHQSFSISKECLVSKCPLQTKEMGMCTKHYSQLRAGIINEQGQKLRDFIRRPRKKKWIGRDGYVLVAAPVGHPNPRADGTILEHRLVMESLIGRPLYDWEIVHHKDGNRQNNTPENLELMDGRSRHGIGHPPGSDLDKNSAIQVLLQQSDLPDGLRQWLNYYRFGKIEQELLTYQQRPIDILKDIALSS